jgi:hypothetical protein
VFIGYISSFFIALLLSFFYLSYAASGIFEQIKKEFKDDVRAEIIEESYDTVSAEQSFAFDYYYYTDIPAPNHPAFFAGLTAEIPAIDNDIPIRKIFLSEYFLRPPPDTL